MGQFLSPKRGPRIAYKRSTSPLTTGTLWTYTGGIVIKGIYGIVRIGVQAQATNCKLSVKNDSLTAVDVCANADLTGDAAGTLLHITGTNTDVLQEHTNGLDGNSDALAGAGIATICTTSGIVTVTFGAASTGVIDWYMMWEPLTAGASVT